MREGRSFLSHRSHTCLLKSLIGALVSCGVAFLVHSQSMPAHFRYPLRAGEGDYANTLLQAEWLSGPGTIEYCDVSIAGKVSSARYVINWAVQGSYWATLDPTNLNLLKKLIDSLPQAAPAWVPGERILVVRGLREGKRFEYVYDRTNLPPEVLKLYEVTGVYLKPSELKAGQSSQIGDSSLDDSFVLASKVPVAVSIGKEGMRVWDIKHQRVQKLIPIESVPYNQEFGSFAEDHAISPDGKILVTACCWGVCALDLSTQKILWNRTPPDPNANRRRHVVIGGSRGQYLFVAGSHRLERWDLRSGKSEAVLLTNEPTISVLVLSRNGKVLLAGCNDQDTGESQACSFSIWKVDDAKPCTQVNKGGLLGAGLSPDGKTVAFCGYFQTGLDLWQWADNKTKAAPLGLPARSLGVTSICWNHNGSRLAVVAFASPTSIALYETATWRRIAQLPCASEAARVDFDNDGKLVCFQDGRQVVPGISTKEQH